MTRSVGRWAVLLVATLTALVMSVGGAWASTNGPQSPSLSDVTVSGGTLHGILTVPNVDSAAAIDTTSLEVQFGSGAPRPATVSPIAQEKRTALILIDTSGSMAGGKLKAAKSAATSFLAQLPKDVYVGLAGFADHPQLMVKPTRNHAPVLAALGRLTAHGETSLYDAIRLGAKDLGTGGSRTIVLLSDGGDTVSRASLKSAESMLGRSGVHMSAIGFKTDESQYGVLSKLAAAGQGSMVGATDNASLEKAFGSAAQRIAAQVRVAVAVPANVGGHQDITVSGVANGKPFTAVAHATLPPLAAQPASTATGPATHVAPAAGFVSGPFVWIAAGAVFIGLLAVILLAASSVFTPRARKRILNLDSYIGTAVGAAKHSSTRRGVDLTGGLLRVGDAFARRHESSAKTALLLERADLPLRVNEWYVLRGLAIFVGACLGWFLLHGSTAGLLIGLLLGLLAGFLLPPILLSTLAGRRARKFEIQLPDVLTLIASSLTSGFSLPQAVDATARDAAEPAAKEFARALAETRIGADLEDALDRMATRMDSTNMTWTVMAIRIQRHVGGNLAETLRTTAKTLRERESLRRQVLALSADGRLSAYILIALPILLGGWMYVVNRAYLALLWTTLLGGVMLVFAAVAMTMGILWMRQTVKVEV